MAMLNNQMVEYDVLYLALPCYDPISWIIKDVFLCVIYCLNAYASWFDIFRLGPLCLGWSIHFGIQEQ